MDDVCLRGAYVYEIHWRYTEGLCLDPSRAVWSILVDLNKNDTYNDTYVQLVYSFDTRENLRYMLSARVFSHMLTTCRKYNIFRFVGALVFVCIRNYECFG